MVNIIFLCTLTANVLLNICNSISSLLPFFIIPNVSFPAVFILFN